MGSTKKSTPGREERDHEAELEWIRFREATLGDAAYSEAAGTKFWRKVKENPFVPIGALATVGALTYGLWCFRSGRSKDSQMLMRARIAAQGFTVVAILGGIAMGVSKSPAQPPPNIRAEAEPAPTKT